MLFVSCLFEQILFFLCCFLWVGLSWFVFLIKLFIFALLFVLSWWILFFDFYFRIRYKPHCLGLENSTHNIYRLYPVVNGGPHPLLGLDFFRQRITKVTGRFDSYFLGVFSMSAMRFFYFCSREYRLLLPYYLLCGV